MIKNKLIGIFVCIVLIAITIIPVSGIDNIEINNLEEQFLIDKQEIATNVDSDIDWWSQHQHDPQNTGYSTSTAPNTSNVLWACKLIKSRALLSHPIVVDNRVYIGGGGEDLSVVGNFIGDKDFGGKLYCIDAITGGLLWMVDYLLEGDLHNQIIVAPVVDNNRVYVCPSSLDTEIGEVHCYDALNGDLLWKTNDIGEARGSPTIVDDKLYVSVAVEQIGSHHKNKIYCLNTLNGNILWDFSAEGLNGCPAVVDNKVYVSRRGKDNNYSVCCLNYSTGELIWDWKNPFDQGSYCSPTVVDDKVFIGSEGFGRVGPNGSEYFPGALFCIDATYGKTNWISDFRQDFLASLSYYDDKLYAGSNVYMDPFNPFGGSSYTFYCVKAVSGGLMWEKTLPIPTGIMNPPSLSSPVIADGKVFVAAPNRFSCKYYCFNASTGDMIWSYKVPGWLTISSGPAVADGQLYFPFSTMSCRNGKLFCFSDIDPDAPNAPLITGKRIGKKGNEYEYTITTTDPNGDDVYLYINWGDGTINEWLGPYGSDEEVKVNHTWSEKGKYEIRIRAKDTDGLRGPIGINKIYMFKNKVIDFLFDLLNWLNIQLPNMVPILQNITV